MTLREARLAAGLTQVELVELSGVSLRTIQKIEAGDVAMKNVTISTMQALSGALGVDIGEITEQEAGGDVRVLRVQDFLFREGNENLTPEELRRLLKWEQAKEQSGLRQTPRTCDWIFAWIPDAWLDQFSASHIGEVARLLKAVYDDGVKTGLDRCDAP